MVASQVLTDREALVARLATTAYEVALRHGIKGSFVELELNMWRALRTVCDKANDYEEGNS